MPIARGELGARSSSSGVPAARAVIAAIATLVATLLLVNDWGIPVGGMLLTVALGILALHALQRERRATRLVGRKAADRDRVEAELRAAELRHRLLADNATDTILAFGADGCITYVSPACSELIGHPPHEIVGRPPRDFVHPDDRHEIKRAHERRGGGWQHDHRHEPSAPPRGPLRLDRGARAARARRRDRTPRRRAGDRARRQRARRRRSRAARERRADRRRRAALPHRLRGGADRDGAVRPRRALHPGQRRAVRHHRLHPRGAGGDGLRRAQPSGRRGSRGGDDAQPARRRAEHVLDGEALRRRRRPVRVGRRPRDARARRGWQSATLPRPDPGRQRARPL